MGRNNGADSALCGPARCDLAGPRGLGRFRNGLLDNFTLEFQPAKVSPLHRTPEPGDTKSMNRPSSLIVAIVWCVLVIVNGASAGEARAGREVAHTVRGVVESVHASETPPTIMMTTTIGGKEEVLIGAYLAKNAMVVRGKQRIALDRIRVGETVTLTYVKTRRGLAALSIVVGPN